MRALTDILDHLAPQKKLLIIGSAFVDIIIQVPRLPQSGEDVEGTSRQQVVGGCAYNVADAVDKLGLPFDALIPIGEGMIADRVRGAFRDRGYRLREFPFLGDNGWCISYVEPSGERTFVSMSGIEKCFRARWLDAVKPEEQDLFYLSGYQADARNADFIAALLKRKRKDAVLLFDPGPCAGRIPEAMMQELLAANTILKVNSAEARVLAPAPTAAEAAALLSQQTNCRVVVTDGANGALVASAGDVTRIPGFPTTVVDTIGSGDAHAGGILAGLMSGATLEDSVLLGNAVASWVTSQEGAATAPNIDNLRRRHR